MRTSNFIKRSLFIVFSILAVSCLYAGEIVITKGDPIPPEPQLDSFEMIPVSATEDNDELAVYFDEVVGDAIITVYDANNQLVFQDVIDTDSQSAAFFDISTCSSGDYTLTISYGTNLTGEFTIE